MKTRITSLMNILVLTLVVVGFIPIQAGASHDPATDPSVSYVSGPSSLSVNSSGWAIPNPMPDPYTAGNNEVKQTCLVDPCPVLVYGSYTYWAYSYGDNRNSLQIVAHNSSTGAVANTWNLDGPRYIASITVDSIAGTVTFVGQADYSASMTWAQLHLEEPYSPPPPPSVVGVCPLFDTTRPFKAGSTVPVKFILCDDAGTNLSSGEKIVTATGFYLVSSSNDGSVQASGNANPDNNFRYDASLGGYIYNLSTKGLTPGTYILTFTVDGVVDDSYSITLELR